MLTFDAGMNAAPPASGQPPSRRIGSQPGWPAYNGFAGSLLVFACQYKFIAPLHQTLLRRMLPLLSDSCRSQDLQVIEQAMDGQGTFIIGCSSSYIMHAAQRCSFHQPTSTCHHNLPLSGVSCRGEGEVSALRPCSLVLASSICSSVLQTTNRTKLSPRAACSCRKNATPCVSAAQSSQVGDFR